MPDLATETRNAFEFIEKLYFETSYLIKEVEGQLQEEEERFVIVRPSGYQVSAVHSDGLEPANVKSWLRKVVAVAFVPEAATSLVKGQTATPLDDRLRVLFLVISFFAEGLREPTAFFGVVRGLQSRRGPDSKLERLMWRFPALWQQMFVKPPTLDFEDGTRSMKGKFKKLGLYSLTDSEEVRKKVVAPMLSMYRA